MSIIDDLEIVPGDLCDMDRKLGKLLNAYCDEYRSRGATELYNMLRLLSLLMGKGGF